jgi:hypothetical protein
MMPIAEIQTERDNLLCMYTDDYNRWFDKYPEFRKSINKLKALNKQDKVEIVHGIEDLILKYDNKFFNRYERKFPLESNNIWYDQDLYSWLIINSLRYLDEDLITDIIIYLNEKM